MNKIVFDYSHYKPYLNQSLNSKGAARGRKAQAAAAMQMQPAYLSQVLKGMAHLSLEQAELLNSFFLHTEEESHFFLLLVQKDRSGTKRLQSYFQKQIDQTLKNRMILTQRLGNTTHQLTEPQKQQYYSSWVYAAAHIAVTIPELQNKKALCQFLNIKPDKLLIVLDFLTSAGLIEQKGEHLYPGTARVRLGNDSHHIIKHHSNWRLQAIESLEKEEIHDLHYSGVMSISEKDVEKIKNQLLENIKNVAAITQDSAEEKLYVIGIDFFNLMKQVR